MALAFMLYLLCAITDCPPPVSQNTNPALLLKDTLVGHASSIVNRRLAKSEVEPGVNLENVLRSDYPLVTTSLGDIQGKFMKSREGREIAAFEGIPYGVPPVGQNRLRNPLPVTPWTGKLKIANKTKADCLQLDFGRLMRVRGAEDCLYLNIYSPSIESSEETPKKVLLPVIVFIHGGGWMSHSGSHYGPRYLLDKDVILVTFNYRLGVLGFLSTGDKHAFGNFGLKDQVLALSFVRDHISDFGGDPKKITLMGQSTGAGSAALHILSPMTSQQISIHGAIVLAGSSLNHWSIMNDTISNTKAIAKRLNCPTDNSDKLVNCLRLQDPYMLVGQQLHLWTIPTISRLLFGPVIEPSENNPSPFIIEAPEVTYNEKREQISAVPVISGVNAHEGGLFAANVYLVPFLFRAINSNWNKMAAYAMAYDNQPGVKINETSEKISNYYFNGKKWSFNNRNEISDALGDRTITTGVYKFLQSHSQVAPTYGYLFSYPNNKSSFLSQTGLRVQDWGVSHGDELPYIFSMDRDFEPMTNPEDLEMSQFMVSICVNFANDKQPFPKNAIGNKVIWSPILNPTYMKILEINKSRKMISFPYTDRMKFWESLKLN